MCELSTINLALIQELEEELWEKIQDYWVDMRLNSVEDLKANVRDETLS